MAIETCRVGEALVIQADHRLDSVTAQDFHDRLDAAVESAERVVVDMAGLTYISSADLRVIMQAVRKTQRQNVSLSLCALSAEVREVFRTSGFDQLVEIQPSREEALAAIGG